jgi:hypothetical protein
VRLGHPGRGRNRRLDFAKASGLEIKENGTIQVNHFTLETSRPRFFAGGDLVTGASNVSNAMAYGKKAAQQHRPATDGRALGDALPEMNTSRRRRSSRARAAVTTRGCCRRTSAPIPSRKLILA